jgi:isocitrate lyase
MHHALTYGANDPRWSGITRPYSCSDVVRLRGSIQIEYTLARLGAERLWNLMHTDAYVPALGAITGNQAIEMVQAGLKAIYGSGWQVAADGNTAGDVYPDQSLYSCDSGQKLVKDNNRA